MKNVLNKIRSVVISKKTLMVIIVILVLLAGLIAISQVNKYSKALDLKQQLSSLDGVLEDSAQNIKLLGDNTDPENVVSEFDNLHSRLKYLQDNLKSEVKIFGYELMPQEDRELSNKIKQSLDSVLKNIEQSKQLVEYEAQLLPIISKVEKLNGQDLKQQKNLAAMWASVEKDIKAISPPEIAKDLHKKLLSLVESISDTSSDLPKLMEAKNYDGFVKKSAQVSGAYSKLIDMNSNFIQVAVNQDIAIDQSIKLLKSYVSKANP